MSQKLHVKKGDTVVVISGKEKGKQGEIIAVDIKKERVTVKGLNLVKRHTKPSQANPQGGIIEKEGTIHVSNVMVLDPEQNVPTRTRKVEENGSLVRVAVKSGAKL